VPSGQPDQQVELVFKDQLEQQAQPEAQVHKGQQVRQALQV
jgi:hypothetical protein